MVKNIQADLEAKENNGVVEFKFSDEELKAQAEKQSAEKQDAEKQETVDKTEKVAGF